MLLLAGRAAGTVFGPDSYQERVEWATEGSPPNLVAIIARVAGQTVRSATPVRTIHSPPVALTPEIAARIRVNREAALQRLNMSPSPATFSPVKLVSTPSQATPAQSTPSQSKTTTPLQVTPPTMQRPIASLGTLPTPPTQERQVVCSDRSIAAAGSVYAALARKMPPITPSSQCFKCAGAHSADQCRAPAEERISNILFAAKCCAQCALPLTKIGHYNLHPSLPGKSCNGSRFFVNMLMRQPIDTISKVFRSGNLEQQLELLASFIPL
jgi:hypothetical protein